jgi:hypothetical protein
MFQLLEKVFVVFVFYFNLKMFVFLIGFNRAIVFLSFVIDESDGIPIARDGKCVYCVCLLF